VSAVARSSPLDGRQAPRGASRPPRVLVLGDLVLDVVLTASVPIEVGTDVPGSVHIRQGGSAANSARWMARLGVRTQLDARSIGGGLHPIEIGLESVEVQHQRRGVDVVDGLARAGCGGKGQGHGVEGVARGGAHGHGSGMEGAASVAWARASVECGA